MLQTIRCKLSWHKWGSVQGVNWGAYHKCTYCGNTKRLPSDRPPEAHDEFGLSH